MLKRFADSKGIPSPSKHCRMVYMSLPIQMAGSKAHILRNSVLVRLWTRTCETAAFVTLHFHSWSVPISKYEELSEASILRKRPSVMLASRFTLHIPRLNCHAVTHHNPPSTRVPYRICLAYFWGLDEVGCLPSSWDEDWFNHSSRRCQHARVPAISDRRQC